MTLRRAYAPLSPELDGFLFAAVGEEVNGIPLSVISALSQLGLDPRLEATRLSRLRNEVACDQLAGMIGRLTNARWTPEEARIIAAGLLARLAKGSRPDDSLSGENGNNTVTTVKTSNRTSIWLVFAALFAAFLVYVTYASVSSKGEDAPQSQSHIDR